MSSPQEFVAACLKDVGYTENPPGSNKNRYAPLAGHANGQPWCASFCVAKAREVGLKLPYESAYTPTLSNGFKQAGRWHTTPEPGDLIFFNWPGDGVNRIQHVGVVVEVRPTEIVTVEGNTSSDNSGDQSNGGGVWKRVRARNSSIVGYGRPNYQEDTMPTPEEYAKAVWAYAIPNAVDGGVASAGTVVSWAHLDSNTAVKLLRDMPAIVDQVVRDVLSDVGPVDPAGLSKAISDELARRLVA